MDYILHLAIVITIYSILAISLNYVAGYTGILSLSHATFYGLGAYTTAILTTQYGFTFIPSVLAGMIVSGVVAYLASFPMLRLKEDALVLVSFGFSIIMFNLMLNLDGLTSGPLGIKGIMAPTIFGLSFFSKTLFFGLVLLAAIITYFFFRRITKSPYGIIIKGIRESRTVAAVNGHHVLSYQRSVFTVAAIFAAAAGSFSASYLTFIEPKLFDLLPSVLMLIMVILGGMASLRGSVLGAFILILVPELLRFLGLPDAYLAEVQQMIYGGVLIFVMYLRPQGLLGEYKI